jgi:hypothetical protein
LAICDKNWCLSDKTCSRTLPLKHWIIACCQMLS